MQIHTPLPGGRHIIKSLENLDLPPFFVSFPGGDKSHVRIRCNSDGYITEPSDTPRMEREYAP
jgi:hypothetical protein